MSKPSYPPDPTWLPSFIPVNHRQEGPWWDFKWTVPDGIEKIIVAYANDFEDFGGGYIIIGLDGKYSKPDGLMEAQLDAEELKCINKARECRPAISGLKSSERIEVPGGEGRFISALWVPQSASRPHTSTDDKFYIRVGASTRVGQPHEVKKLYSLPAQWQSANYLALSRWRAERKTMASLVPGDHRDIVGKVYDATIGDLGPTYVNVHVITISNSFSIPLDDLILAEDPTRSRPLLILKQDRWKIFGNHWDGWSGK